jgi:hypothetical protein
MTPRDRIIEGIRQLLEQQYLESVNDRSKDEYARLSETEKRGILKPFLQRLTAGSKAEQWAKALGDVL